MAPPPPQSAFCHAFPFHVFAFTGKTESNKHFTAVPVEQTSLWQLGKRASMARHVLRHLSYNALGTYNALCRWRWQLLSYAACSNQAPWTMQQAWHRHTPWYRACCVLLLVAARRSTCMHSDLRAVLLRDRLVLGTGGARRSLMIHCSAGVQSSGPLASSSSGGREVRLHLVERMPPVHQ